MNPYTVSPYLRTLPALADEPAGDIGWMDLALCAEVDPELFFVEKGGSTHPAKRVCKACEVRQSCLDYALEHNELVGVWGGMSELERRRMKRQAA